MATGYAQDEVLPPYYDPQQPEPDDPNAPKPAGTIQSSPREGVLPPPSAPGPTNYSSAPSSQDSTPKLPTQAPDMSPYSTQQAPDYNDWPSANQYPTGQTGDQPVSTAPTVARTQQTSQQTSTSGDIDAIKAFYQKYLGRAANEGDAEKWLSGAYGYGTDLATIEDAIRNSPEAQSKSGAGGGATPSPGSSVSDALTALYKSLGKTATGPGTGPTDIAYFIKRINETGGMTPENIKYWFGPDGRVAREVAGKVPPEQGPGETPPNTGGPGGGGGGDTPPMDQATHDAIMRLLARGEKPVTGADVQDQYAPAAAAFDRSAQLARAAAAQRGAVTGTNIGGGGGALDAEVNSIHEQVGSQQGQLMAKLIGDELSARRQDVYHALQFAQGDEKMALDRQLALIDAEIRRQAMANQNQQFYDDLGFRIGSREYDYNRQNETDTTG